MSTENVRVSLSYYAFISSALSELTIRVTVQLCLYQLTAISGFESLICLYHFPGYLCLSKKIS